MKRGQLLLALVAALAVGAVAWFAGGKGDKDEPSTKPTAAAKAPAGAVKVSFAYSPEKEKLLLPLIKKFNGEGNEVGGKPVFVEGINASSGDAETRIAKGQFKPVAWSPASSLWGRLLNFEADRPYTAEEAPSIVRTPLVIAVWEPMARALGYPKKKLGYADVLRLSTSGKGWAEFGRPEFGDFKLVHTAPDFSTSGLSFVVAEYYAALGKKEGLVEKDIANAAARKRVRDIERSIVHYGDTTLFIAEQLKKEGPGYASAVAMEEVTLLDFNRTRGEPRQADRDLSRGGHVRLRLAVLHARRAVGERAAEGGSERVPEVPGRGDHPRGGGEVGLPPRQPGDRAGGADHHRQRRRPEAARAHAPAARAARAGRDQEGLAPRPQARQHPARARHLGLDERGAAPRPGEGGARRVLPQRRAAGLGRADDLLREGAAAGRPGAAEPRAATSCARGCAT